MREYAKEYFTFWPDGEDLLWFKGCWGALQRAGLNFIVTDEERDSCLARVPLLALSYQEFCLRLGHQVRGLAITAIMDTVIDEGSEEADTQFALIHRALLAAYDEKGFFEYSLRSVIQGSNEPLPLTVVDQMARKAAAEMPFGGDDRAREAYQFLARGLKSSRSYRTLRSFL